MEETKEEPSFEIQREQVIEFLRKQENPFPQDATNFECFAIKGLEAFIGFKSSDGNFNFVQIPYTGPKT